MSKCLCQNGKPCTCGDNCRCKTEQLLLAVNPTYDKITVKPEIIKQQIKEKY